MLDDLQKEKKEKRKKRERSREVSVAHRQRKVFTVVLALVFALIFSLFLFGSMAVYAKAFERDTPVYFTGLNNNKEAIVYSSNPFILSTPYSKTSTSKGFEALKKSESRYEVNLGRINETTMVTARSVNQVSLIPFIGAFKTVVISKNEQNVLIEVENARPMILSHDLKNSYAIEKLEKITEKETNKRVLKFKIEVFAEHNEYVIYHNNKIVYNPRAIEELDCKKLSSLPGNTYDLDCRILLDDVAGVTNFSLQGEYKGKKYEIIAPFDISLNEKLISICKISKNQTGSQSLVSECSFNKQVTKITINNKNDLKIVKNGESVLDTSKALLIEKGSKVLTEYNLPEEEKLHSYAIKYESFDGEEVIQNFTYWRNYKDIMTDIVSDINIPIAFLPYDEPSNFNALGYTNNFLYGGTKFNKKSKVDYIFYYSDGTSCTESYTGQDTDGFFKALASWQPLSDINTYKSVKSCHKRLPNIKIVPGDILAYEPPNDIKTILTEIPPKVLEDHDDRPRTYTYIEKGGEFRSSNMGAIYPPDLLINFNIPNN